MRYRQDSQGAIGDAACAHGGKTPDGDAMAPLTGVRDRLRELFGHEPHMWVVIEVVLEVVDAHLNENAERARVVGDAETAPDGDIARAATARGLPATTELTELLAHERSSAAMLAVREVFDDVAPWRREAEESRRVLASARQLLDALRSRPIASRPPVEREAVSWLVDRLEGALGPRLPLLEAALEAERARVALLAAELAAPAGMARVEWLARLNAALSAALSAGPTSAG